MRPVAVKGAQKYQISCYTERQVFQENVEPAALADSVLQRFPEYLTQMHVLTEEYDYAFRMTKKGRLLTNRTRRRMPETTIELSGRKRDNTKQQNAENGKLARAHAGHQASLGDMSNRKRADARVGQQASLGDIAHNRQKNYILQEGTVIPPLVDMGIFTKEGKIVKTMYDKYRQINRFVELVDDVLKNEKKQTLHIVDFGCGKSYLTFILYYYLVELCGKQVEIVGLDLKEDVIRHCNEAAEKYGYEHLHFELGDINGYRTDMPVDMVVTLHACDTATDYALYNAVQWNAKYILSVPCCQHEVNGQIASELFTPLLKYGIIKERMSALVTDAVRGEMLTYCGYRTQILEFVDLAHSPKNLLIRAVRSAIPKEKRERSLQEVQRMCEELHIEPSIYRLLRTKGREEVYETKETEQ